jgi:hypothetical protein
MPARRPERFCCGSGKRNDEADKPPVLGVEDLAE